MRLSLAARPVLAILVLASAVVFSLVRAAEPLPLSADQPVTVLDRHTTHYADARGEVDLAGAQQLAAEGAFSPYSIRTVLFDLSGPVHWLRTELANPSARAARWVIDYNFKTAPLVEVSKVSGGRSERLLTLGPESHFGARPLPFRNVAVAVTLEPGERAEIYTRFQLNTNLEFEPTVQSPEAYLLDMIDETALDLAFHGFISAIVAVTLVVALVLRDRAAGFYALYILTVVSWFFYTDGLAFQYVWPNAPEWNTIALQPFHAAMGFTGALFVREFLDLPRVHPGLDRAFRLVLGITAVIGLSTVFGSHRLLTGMAFLFIVVAAQLYLVTGIVAVRRGWPGAVPFCLGAAAVAIACMFAVYAHAVPEFATLDRTRDWGRVAFLIESSAFLAAIGARIARIRQDRSLAQAEAYRALEAQLALAEELRAADAAHAEARALAERRRAEMAHATHDLRQPLASLRLALGGLRDLPEEARATLGQSAAYLEEVVERYLGQASAAAPRTAEHDPEAAPPSGTTEVFPADLLLGTVGSMFADEARAKGVALRVVPCSAPVEADPMAAMRALTNLASNAVKHAGGEGGRVLIGCRRAGGRLRFLVIDTGPGLSPERLAEVQASGVRGEASEGHGLGLAVVRELAARHGFGFEAASREGRGSAFGIALPRAEAPG